MNKIIVYTKNEKALEKLIEYMTEENVWNVIEKQNNTFKISMLNPVVNLKEHERLQTVMNNGMRALERLYELGVYE